MKSFPFHIVMVSLPPPVKLAWINHSSGPFLTLSGSLPVSLLEPALLELWPLHLAHFPNSGSPITASIQAGSALAICNGPYMPKHFPHLAAAAWIST